jgi:glutathione peroxidase
MTDHFYDFKATSLEGEEISMRRYAGKVVLVVNTASKCGFTPQYEGLETLYRTYKDQGLVILGFPCNQFAHQEPGDEASIASFCRLNFGVSFPIFAKVDVNGNNAHPLFAFLTGRLKGVFGGKVKWNFTKFLLDKNGEPVRRYAPMTKPQALVRDIEECLSRAAAS